VPSNLEGRTKGQCGAGAEQATSLPGRFQRPRVQLRVPAGSRNLRREGDGAAATLCSHLLAASGSSAVPPSACSISARWSSLTSAAVRPSNPE
jgi:hypothetical protein